MPTFVPLNAFPVQLQDSSTSLNMVGGTLEFFLAGTSTPTNLFSDNSGTSIGTSITLNSGGYPEAGGNIITLFRDTSIPIKIVGRNAAAALIFTSDNLEDGLVILASISNAKGASLIGVEDAGSFFAGGQVEVVLQDIGQNFMRLSRNETITGTKTFDGAFLNMQDNVILRPRIGDHGISHVQITQTNATPDFPYDFGPSFVITLTENATFSLSDPPATGIYGEMHIKIIQDVSTRTVSWPASVLWPSGVAPTITVSSGAVDSVSLWTIDAGTTWYGNYSQAYS